MKPSSPSFSVRSALLLVAVASIQVEVTAQSTRKPGQFMRMSGPIRSASLDFATGTITSGPAASNRAGTTVADFKNLDTNGFVGVDSGGGACKWFSAGLKGSGSNQSSNASDLMDSIVFAYCSKALSPSSGGPGGSVTLGFYEGYTVFGGAATTAVAVFSLTGLPSSPTLGGVLCTLLTVQFGNLIAFRDSGLGTHQGIGYSWTFDDLDTGGVWAATFPFFACMSSCSGTVGGVDGQGMMDAIDQYCPPGAAVPFTFTFGTTNPAWSPQTWTTIDMQIQEAADCLATLVTYNATLTPNPDTLQATTAVLGHLWTATVTKAVSSAPAGFTVRILSSRSLPNGTTSTPPVAGRVLIAGTFLASVAGSHNGTTGSTSATVPLSLALSGIPFAAQATIFGGGVKLSSGVAGTTGTF